MSQSIWGSKETGFLLCFTKKILSSLSNYISLYSWKKKRCGLYRKRKWHKEKDNRVEVIRWNKVQIFLLSLLFWPYSFLSNQLSNQHGQIFIYFFPTFYIYRSFLSSYLIRIIFFSDFTIFCLVKRKEYTFIL